jgi:hypothetical protein
LTISTIGIANGGEQTIIKKIAPSRNAKPFFIGFLKAERKKKRRNFGGERERERGGT